MNNGFETAGLGVNPGRDQTGGIIHENSESQGSARDWSKMLSVLTRQKSFEN